MNIRKKLALVIIVTFSCIVLLIPYLAYDFYNQFLNTYGVTDAQMGWLLTAYAASAVPSYFIGGWIADIFNPQKLVIASCVLTGLISFAVAACSSFLMLALLFFCFGITAITLNWSAYLKIIKMIGNDDGQGRLFAMSDIAYAIMSLGLQYIVLAIITYVLADNTNGFKIAYIIYGALSILIGIAVHFAVPNMTYEKEIKGIREDLRLMGYAAKLPITWYLSFFILGYFLIRSVITYLNPYLTDAFEQSIPFAQAFSAAIRTGALMVFSPIGGMLRDRMGQSASKLISRFSIGCIVFSIIMMYIPHGRQYAAWIMVAAVLLLACNGMMSNFLYTLVTTANVPIVYVGSVYGIASAIGYSSDLYLFAICGNWLDSMGNEGYKYIWLIGALGGLLMFAMGMAVKRRYGLDTAKEESGECEITG